MRIIVAAILISQTSIAFSFENLQNGIVITEEVDSAIRNTSIPYAVARQGQRTADDNELVEAFIEVGDAVFSLSSKPDLIKTNTSNRELLGHWPLGHWPQELTTATNQIYHVGNKYTSQAEGDLDRFVDQTYKQQFQTGKTNMGCFNQSPLRYGDIDADSQSELVLFLGMLKYKHDLVIFSPQYQRIAFSMRYALQDAMSFEPSQYQFVSETRNKYNEIGMRAYAKAYFGDFDDDNNPDIIVWRKRFTSRLKTDATVGYQLDASQWEHFEKDLTAQAQLPAGVTGEYLPQTTDTATIQTWLSEKNLTWQKGYPSKSECPGQQGQLIPEMHDPLLNDPEVMQ